MKTIIRRNLPINDNYILIDSFYSSTENGTCCDNCGKLIANIGVIKNDKGQVYHVGMDCAGTLTKVEGLNVAERNFAEAKAIRVKVNKARKEGKTIEIYNYCNGSIIVKCNGFTMAWLERDFSKKYLPDIYKQISNPEKNDFVPIPEDDLKLISYTSKETIEAREYFKNKRTYQHKDFSIDIYLLKAETSTGEWNGSYFFTIDVNLNGSNIGTDKTYMVKDVNRRIYYTINSYLFNQF